LAGSLLLWATAFLRPFRDDEIQKTFSFFFSHLDVKSWTLGVCRNERPRLLSTFPPSFYYYDFDSALFFFIPAGRPLLHSINRRAPFDDKTLGLQVAHFDFDFKRRRKCF
jgi:hypothetical protein